MPKQRILDCIAQAPKVLERNAVFMGHLRGDADYVVHGEIYGDCEVSGMLLVAEDCICHGNISADVVVILGRVEGNISAHTKLELRDYCRVRGDIVAPIIAIGHLARLRGCVAETSYVTHFPERRLH